MARGRQIGDDRFLAGMHYPSDVAAGQKLGAEIARRLLANPDFREQLRQAARECRKGVAVRSSIEPPDALAACPQAALRPIPALMDSSSANRSRGSRESWSW